MALTCDFGSPIVATVTGNIKAGQGSMIGFYVNSTNAGTVILYDSATTTTTAPISGTITPGIGFAWFPATFSNGLYAVIGGSALNVTFFVI